MDRYINTAMLWDELKEKVSGEDRILKGEYWSAKAIKNVLDNFTSVTADDIFKNGMKYAWKMVMELFDMSAGERIDATGYSDVREMVYDLDAVGVDRCLEDWKKRCDPIRVGDEIEYIDYTSEKVKGFVFTINDGHADVYLPRHKDFDFVDLEYESLKKTGRHCVDIEEFINRLTECESI